MWRFYNKNNWSKNCDERPLRISYCYWGSRDPFHSMPWLTIEWSYLLRYDWGSRDSQCFLLGRTTPELALFVGRFRHPQLIHSSLSPHESAAKWHLDGFSCFCTVHQFDQYADRHTDHTMCDIFCNRPLSVYLPVCPLTYLKNRMSRFHKFFCTCYLWPWLGPPVTTVQSVMYVRFCGWHHVFTNGANASNYWENASAHFKIYFVHYVWSNLPGGITGVKSDVYYCLMLYCNYKIKLTSRTVLRTDSPG